MQNVESIRLQLNSLVNQSYHDIYTLSMVNDPVMKQQILQRLWDALSTIQFLSELLASQAQAAHHASYQQPIPVQAGTYTPSQLTAQTPAQLPPSNPVSPQQNQRTFTLEELATYDGKNGRPAYVAVNGVVYDVTNNKAWAAATHFALTAGKDYTKEFASCHAGQQSILATLPVVGRLV